MALPMTKNAQNILRSRLSILCVWLCVGGGGGGGAGGLHTDVRAEWPPFSALPGI